MRIIDADELAKHVTEAYTPEECATKCAFPDDFITRISDMPTLDKWHYPAEGELPEKDGEYLCRYYKYNLRFSKVSHYRVEDNKWYNLVYDEEYRVPKPDAWQYIIPPKEEA